MSTCVVTGGAGFLGSHLCDYLLAEGHRVICVDNLKDGSLEEPPGAHPRRRLPVREPRRRRAHRDRRSGGLRVPPRGPGEPHRLPASAAPLAQGGLVRHAPRAGTRKFKRARFLLNVDERGLRRSARTPRSPSYWGNVNPIGPVVCTTEAKRYAGLTMACHGQQGRRYRDREDF